MKNNISQRIVLFKTVPNIIFWSIISGLSVYPVYAVEIVAPPKNVSSGDSKEIITNPILVQTPYSNDGKNLAGTFGEAHLNAVNQKAAIDANLTGRGVKVGMTDNKVRATAENKRSLVSTKTYYNLDDQRAPEGSLGVVVYDPAAVDEYTHGSGVAQMIGGDVVGGQTRGGVAPLVQIYSAAPKVLGVETTYQGWDDMAKAGVSIINNSWGTVHPTWWHQAESAVNLYKDEAEAYLNADVAAQPYTAIGRTKRLVDKGVLLTFAAGNSQATQPVHEALRPLAEPDIQKGMIVVAGLEGTVISESSSHCGSAKNWCMAAPFTIEVSSQNAAGAAEPYTQHVLQGTSFAVPIVSGGAALVKQKFPWMVNDQLRTTLLTTATDIGAKGVDSVYGWGSLNLNKAIKGPAQFAFGDFVADVTHPAGMLYSIYGFDNDISGSGGLIKRGPARLDLNGTNTYSGNTKVESGILRIKNKLASPMITVESRGQLQMAKDSKAQSLTNHGWVVLKDGKVSLAGDFTQSKQASLVQTLESSMTVGGQANLAGNLWLVPQRYVGSEGKRYPLLKAEKGIKGGFSKVYTGVLLNNPDILDASDKQIDFVVNRKNTVSIVQSLEAPNATLASVDAAAFTVERTLQELDTLSDTDLASSTLASSAASLQAADESQLYASLNSLSAATYANSAAIHSIEQGKQAQVFSGSLNGVEADKAQAILHYTHTDVDWKQSGASGKQNSNGVLAGVAKNLGNLTVGAAYSHNNTGWNESFGHRADSDSNGLMLGARYVLPNQSYLKGLLGYSRFSSDVTRTLSLGNNGETIRNKVTGNLWQVGVGVGKDFALNERWKVTPEVGLRYDHITRSAFKETNNSDFGWASDRLNKGVLAGTGSLEAEYAVNQTVGITAKLGFEHDFTRRRFNTGGQFTGATAARGDAGAWKIPQTRANAGVGIKASLSKQLSANAGYRFSGASDYRNHALDAGLHYTF